MIFAVPLAWLQLTYEKSRLLVAIAGISFAVILMFMQIGFRDALFTSAVRMQSNLVGDLVLISPQSTNLVGMRNFSERRTYQAMAMEGVESVNSLYIGLGAWKIKEDATGQTRNILVLGGDPDAKIFKMPGISAENLALIKQQDVVLFDRGSRFVPNSAVAHGFDGFGPVVKECGVDDLKTQATPEAFRCPNFVTREVANRKLIIGGLFELGASFAADGTIITSDANFLRILDNRRKGLINLSLINVDPKLKIKDNSDLTRQNIDRVKQNLSAIMPNDVKVLTMEGFIEFERGYWQRSTAIGFIFSLGTVMGFIVGIVIVYQILYTDVSDHLAEYATLKAMGYNNFFLSKVVLQEAVVLSVLGFFPGMFISMGLYNLTQNATRLPLYIWDKALPILGLTVVMCTISGAISLRRVQSADPAEIFG
ncbi:MAG: ABC transporter permease DevC [Pseudanabaena sp. ELA607]